MADLTGTYLYSHVIRRHCTPVTIATSISAQALHTCHVVIAANYTSSLSTPAPASSNHFVSPLHSGDHRYIYICAGATYLSRHHYPLHLLQRRQITNPNSCTHQLCTLHYILAYRLLFLLPSWYDVTDHKDLTIHASYRKPYPWPVYLPWLTHIPNSTSALRRLRRMECEAPLLHSFFNFRVQRSCCGKRAQFLLSGVVPDGRAVEFVQLFQELCNLWVSLCVRHRQQMYDRS